MELTARLTLGLLLPWAAGLATLVAFWPPGRRQDWLVALGYGWALGLVLLMLVMRLLAWLGLGFGLASVTLALAMITTAGLVAAGWRQRFRPGGPSAQAAAPLAASRLASICVFIVAAVVILRLAMLGIEIWFGPLYPWDAYTVWAPRARVWHALGDMVPFVTGEAWWRGEGYNAAHPHYSASIPLIQTWMALALDRWDDSLINLPWLLTGGALALAFWGQAHRSVGPVTAAVFVYFLISLPMLGANIAGAGLVDLYVAKGYGLAGIALYEWVRSGERGQLTLAAVGALLCVLAKEVGLIWLVAMSLPVAVWALPAKWRSRAVAGIVLVGIGLWLLAPFVPQWLGVVPQPIELHFRAQALGPFMETMWWHLGWNLLPYATAAALVTVAWQLRQDVPVVVLSAMVIIGSAPLGIIFLFSDFAGAAVDGTGLSRHMLHTVPLHLFLVMVVWSRVSSYPIINGNRGRPATVDTGERPGAG